MRTEKENLTPQEAELLQALEKVEQQFAGCPVRPCCEARPAETVMVPMEDGIRLRTVIYRPELEGAVPTIVTRTCYPQNEPLNQAIAEQYTRRGFAYVYQLCRGTGGSEGEWVPNVYERPDGKQALEWLSRQAWVESIGYLGISYLALTGWAIADIVPDKVKTMYLGHYGTHRFDSAYKDGLFRHDIMTAWAMGNAGFPITADYTASCLYRPHGKVDEELWGKRLDWYRDYLNNTDRDAPYWNEGIWQTLKEIPTRVKIPFCLVGSWYDHHQGSAIKTWQSMPEEVQKAGKFIIGAWDHGFNMRLQDRETGDFRTDDNLRAFEWFYQALVKRRPSGGGIECYVIGADTWKRYGSFHEPHHETRLYLSASRDGAHGLLDGSPVDNEERLQFTYDPGNPVPTHGGESLLQTREESGSLLQDPPGTRSDVVSFFSQSLQEDLEVYGQMKLHLTVSTSADDTAFVFKVMEVMENGRAYNIRTGVTTLAYRNGSVHRQAYSPNSRVDIVIDSWVIACRFHAGSRIRVDVTSSDFPQYSVHSNYAGPWADQKESRPAKQTLYLGAGTNSYLELPEIGC